MDADVTQFYRTHPPQRTWSHWSSTFESLQRTFSGQYFKKVEDVQNCIDEFISLKPQSFFHYGGHSLPPKWQKVIESNRDYSED